MILKELYLYPDLVEYSDNVVDPFRDQSRSICNFLERELKPVKFKTNGFKRICFIGKSVANSKCWVNSSNVLTVEIEFDEKQYLTLAEEELNPYFMTLLKTGLIKCHEQFAIPLEHLISSLERFSAGGYVNKWCFKTKQIKELGIKCALNCQLTTNNFLLTLVVSKGKEIIYDKEILKTDPDEIVFTPMVKDIHLDGDKLIVSDKFGDPTYHLPVKELNM
ncbi:hypothetical protein SG34_033225 [Thalassomonas viridans]|uniref:Uncharacterized protein n=1 Tax=Thalassomonas viridans TaxID=137584 RepID=A0AAE9Z929_9GAMM|nr:hypothetical protein [Thalassomonas viridans]WDE08763.1 hypothetical protein SG34_033225 [Thalassomonas viridans]